MSINTKKTPEEITLGYVEVSRLGVSKCLPLDGLGITTLPLEIFKLSHLAELTLRNNNISAIPPEIRIISKRRGNVPKVSSKKLVEPLKPSPWSRYTRPPAGTSRDGVPLSPNYREDTKIRGKTLLTHGSPINPS